MTLVPVPDTPGRSPEVRERKVSQRLMKALAVGRVARLAELANARQLAPPTTPLKPC